MGTDAMRRKRSGVFVPSEQEGSHKRPWFGELPADNGEDAGKSEDAYAFAVIGDRCGMATAGVFEQAMDLLADLKPAFIVSVGDSIEGYWRDAAAAHDEWAAFDGIVEASGLPFFPVAGNHDYGSRLMAEVWRSRKGADYYAFRFKDTLFLMLNTEQTPDELPDPLVDVIKRVTADFQREPERAADHLRTFAAQAAGAVPPEELSKLSKIRLAFGEEQLAFVERMLAEHRDVKRTFVTMHKPGWKSESADYARLAELLGSRPHTMFAGHLHALEYECEAGSERIQMGRTGGMPHSMDGRDAEANMILWVTVRDGQPSYRVLPLDGVRAIEAYAPNHHAAAGRASE